ncbi:MAG: DUF177 domain-containing protein [Anaerolineales bacterium]|nr:DUF177 domain-containing protein [Anaerolineales bacterium]
MSKQSQSRLRFNFGFLLEAGLGTSRIIELDYPTIRVAQDLDLTPLQGVFTATRTSEGVYLSGMLSTNMVFECVRCLEDAEQTIEIDLDELFYYPAHTAPPGEYVIRDDGFVDLAPLVRESALLAIPVQPLCKPNCQGLCMECGQNLNEADCGCDPEDIDPRLAALKDFL